MTASLAHGTDIQAVRRVRWRWMVHLGLLLTATAALVTLQFLHVRTAIHAVAGLAFVTLVSVHLGQRRHTVARMLAQLGRAQRLAERRARLAGSDLLLWFIALNVLVSGALDWARGRPSLLPLPAPFDRWHGLSGIVLVIHLAVHVWHRRRRLRTSSIR